MTVRNIRIEAAYDGSGFFGWQRQPGKRTVQGTLEAALSDVIGAPAELAGASRTDAGVHALGQSATFTLDSGIPTERIAGAMNDRLEDIRVTLAEDVPADFHARFSAVGKTYVYRIIHGAEPDIFKRLYAHRMKESPDVRLMEKAAELIEGQHDFAAFMSSGSSVQKSTVRTVHRISISDTPRPPAGREILPGVLEDAADERVLTIQVCGDGFLYNMVRIIAGTLLEVGCDRLPIERVCLAITEKKREFAGPVAPACGLYLKKVWYNEMNMRGDRG